ncbi:hypothetical protein F4Z99_16900 [Candidatus Poribacteria bacterium]|nr:hypothetical protein [Candidatus Poribacteria bacterium]MYB01507.1 hypothetical protein [Candidatus Poribacteria bacterium]
MKTLNNKITLSLDGDAEVSVKGFIAPIEHTLSHFHIEWVALANLRVAEPEKQHHVSIFQAFLPDEPVSVGECWQIQESGVLALLRQLHTALNLNTDDDSGDSIGLWACLRAYNDRFADIAFRIHAAFKLEDGWLTPSQFAGNLIIDRLEGKIAFFEMSVPEGTVNLDIGWKEDKAVSYSITDAGFCSQMQLRAGARDVAQNIEFLTSITQEEAERVLAGRFYKSEQINWVSPYQAVEMAEEQVKLIHAISIDGPLADESC